MLAGGNAVAGVTLGTMQGTRAVCSWNTVCRLGRGLLSSLSSLISPAGLLWRNSLNHLRTPERRAQGLVIVLPGIEGESCLNQDIAWGLADAEIPYAIEIWDWTSGSLFCFLDHLSGWKRNARAGKRIADRIVAYQRKYPGRPVHLIGHSGGGAIALLALNQLPESSRVTSTILLAAAVSPEFDLTRALERCSEGIWNFSTPLDLLYLGAGTRIWGTVDRVYCTAAGASGFRIPEEATPAQRRLYQQRLRECPYDFRMAASFNFGGHFGCVNRVFIAEWIAPLLHSSSSSPDLPFRGISARPEEEAPCR